MDATLQEAGGEAVFAQPLEVDPNTGVAMYESDDIIKYLVNKYGNGQVPLLLSLGLLTTLTEGFAMIGRLGRGQSYTHAKSPPKPLVLWAYEVGSPFCKLVREALVEMELPHIQRSCARGSPKRQELYARVGHFQVESGDEMHHTGSKEEPKMLSVVEHKDCNAQ
ncbi:hypothetical protein Cgig2_022417 [Carnegiea gigantea]|uniref:GST N-terminal domain-containing protein n=1 Tax=Carnegiea gigantea TaxID=171969 RepID=A0A9Q1JKS7_9CARY|nr:hypothetical protein Cgig2_022417 [Carnegiea gigantea]